MVRAPVPQVVLMSEGKRNVAQSIELDREPLEVGIEFELLEVA